MYVDQDFDKILELIDKQATRKDKCNLLADLLLEFDFQDNIINFIREDEETLLDKMLLEDRFYSEGNEDAGFIALSTILKGAEEVINYDSSRDYGISFECFVRPETEEEAIENKHDNSCVEWWTEDDRVNIKDLYIQFISE